MRERLEEMTDIAQENLTKGQTQQKRRYDEKARLREFEVGDQVLVLLPTASNKLLAQWQGPYGIVKQNGKVTYVVSMHDKKKPKQVLHVNMLKKFTTRTSDLAFYSVDPDDAEGADIPTWMSESHGESKFGNQLQPNQLKELDGLLGCYRKVFSGKPGRTTLTEHDIETGCSCQIRYRHIVYHRPIEKQ